MGVLLCGSDGAAAFAMIIAQICCWCFFYSSCYIMHIGTIVIIAIIVSYYFCNTITRSTRIRQRVTSAAT